MRTFMQVKYPARCRNVRLITQRSQVQILPPLPENMQVRGLVTGNGDRALDLS